MAMGKCQQRVQNSECLFVDDQHKTALVEKARLGVIAQPKQWQKNESTHNRHSQSAIWAKALGKAIEKKIHRNSSNSRSSAVDLNFNHPRVRGPNRREGSSNRRGGL